MSWPIQKEHRADAVILATLFLLALITRFLGISHQSLWIDEGATYYYSQFSWDQLFSDPEPNSPVFYKMEGVFFELFGRNELVMRAFSAFTGALTVPLVYVLCRKISDNIFVSAVAGALMLISPIMIEYGQEGRGYSAMVFLFVCQAIVLMYCLEKSGWGCWILLSVLSALNLTMQYMSMLGTLVLYLYALLYYRKDWMKKEFGGLLRALASGMLALAISSPLLAHAFRSFREGASHEHWDWCLVGPDYLRNLLVNFLFDIDFLILLVFVAAGAYMLLRKDRERGLMICWITVLPILLTTLASFVMNMTPRYVLWSAVGIYIMLACSVLMFSHDDMRGIARNTAIAGVVIIVLACVCLPPYYSEITKADYRSGAQALEENVQPGDTVVYAPNWENMVYGSLSFYFDPEEHGAKLYPADSDETFLWRLSESSGTVYVLIMQDFPPYGLLSGTGSPACERIYDGYDISVWRVTGPL